MRSLFLTLSTLLILSTSFGQVQFGLKAGLNLASIKDVGLDNSKARIGYNAGGMLQWKFAEKFLLRPELLYSVKGYRSPASQTNDEATASLSYVNLPILFGFRPTQNLSLLLGPELGFLTSAKSNFGGTSHDISSTYREFDIGIDLGLAYYVSKGFGVDLRYCYGFKGLVNVVYTDQYGNVTSQGKTGANRVFQLGIYYVLSK